ncbi:MAG: DsrE family protein [Terriglobia bacterium]
MKAAIVVLSDPKAGTEEALGRVFNALAAAYDFKKRGTPVRVLFQGAGTRWAGELTKNDHPAHALYEEVKDTIEGVSSACAVVFGASEAARTNGFDFIRDNAVPGTAGLPSLGNLAADGYTVLTF